MWLTHVNHRLKQTRRTTLLYDPKWEKTDPISLESLIAWLEKQPEAQRYDFTNCRGGCLLGKYMASVGMAWDMDVYEDLAHTMCPNAPYGHFPIGSELPHTFGAALARARDML
jgi:hypothetical protein